MSDDQPPDDRDDQPRRDGERGSAPSGVLNLGINVGIGSLTDLLGAAGSRSGGRRGWQNVDAGRRRGRDETSAEPSYEPDEHAEVADEFLIDTHRTEEEFVVTAELPGVDETELDVGIDVPSNEFVLAVEGRVVERIALPWASTDAARVWFNNGVLEARFRPAEDGGSGTDAGG